jgi:formate-dependent nitrite reductase membrane component NrfD
MAHAHSTLDRFVVGFDRQREWIERRGLLLLIAFYLGGVGGGLFLASLIIDWKAGIPIALGIVAVGKGSAHLLFLGRPLRFWRAIKRPHSSWISRGVFFMVLFVILGTLYYVYYGNTALQAASGIFAFALIIYTGFALAAAPGIPFWSNPLVPIIFAAAALTSGAALAEASHAIRPETVIVHVDRLETLGLIMGTAMVVLLFTYLVGSYMTTVAAKESVAYLAWGSMSAAFWAGVVLLGIIIPLSILIPSYFGEVARGWLAVAGISELCGSFALRYSLLKAGIYPPVI